MYKVDGDVNITPAIAPVQHDWGILQSEIAQGRAYRAKKAAEEEAIKAAKAHQAAEEAKYNPGNVNDVDYNESLNRKGLEVLDYSAKAYKNGTIGTPQHSYEIGKKRQEAELIKGKANAVLATNTAVYQNIDQLPSYVDKTALNKQVYDASHPKTEKGDINWNAIDPKQITEIPSNYYSAINTADMYKAKIKDLGEKVHSTENIFGVSDPNDGTALGQMIRSDSTKAKFFKPVVDKKGNVIRWTPGVTNEAAQFMLDNDKEVKGEAQNQLDKYIQAETAARISAGDNRDIRVVHNEVEKNTHAGTWMLDHVKNNMERLNETSTEKKLSQGFKYRNPNEGKEADDFKATLVTNQKRNLNVGDKKEDIRPGDIPEEYRFSGKKLDQPVNINSTKIYDENTNHPISGQESIGDKKLYATRTFLMPKDSKTGKYLHGDLESIKKNPNVTWGWVVGGKMDAKEVDQVASEKAGKEVVKDIKKNVFVPYDEVSNDVKAKFGFDLNNRDVSEISDLELGSVIKEKYPDTTPQERLQMFKKVRGQ